MKRGLVEEGLFGIPGIIYGLGGGIACLTGFSGFGASIGLYGSKK